MFSQRAFAKLYAAIPQTLEYNPNWLSHSRHYFHNSVDGPHAVRLAVGERAKSEAEYPDCRRMIFVGTPVGTMGIFERIGPHADGTRSVVIVQCANDDFKKFEGERIHGALREEDIERLVGGNEVKNNVGLRLASMDWQKVLRQGTDDDEGANT